MIVQLKDAFIMLRKQKECVGAMVQRSKYAAVKGARIKPDVVEYA